MSQDKKKSGEPRLITIGDEYLQVTDRDVRALMIEEALAYIGEQGVMDKIKERVTKRVQALHKERADQANQSEA